jgi:hypothetical protein
MYEPRTHAELLEYCNYYAKYSGPIHTTIRKLAAYPVTELSFSGKDDQSGEQYARVARAVKLRAHQVGHNQDRYAYGLAVTVARRKFKKHLVCSNCNARKPITEVRYSWRGYQFHLDCQECNTLGVAQPVDVQQLGEGSVRFVRLNPRHIITRKDPYTGDGSYFFKLPDKLRRQIQSGIKSVIQSVPNVYLNAARHKRLILLRPEHVFVSERTSISDDDIVFSDGTAGVPLIAPVLQDLFFIKILMKSQEAVALEHIVPMRVLFPMVTTEANNVYALANLSDWKREVETQVRLWRKDSNRVVITGFPLGYQQVGGSGRSMLLHQELRLYIEGIISGMGVPASFYYGDVHYTAASVNMRALENEFYGVRVEQMGFAEFYVRHVSEATGWPPAKPKYAPFRMADDTARMGFDLNLVGQRVISKKTFSEKYGIDYAQEKETVAKEMEEQSALAANEAESQAKAQTSAQLIQAKGQIAVQGLMQSVGMGQPDPSQQQAPQQGPGQQQAPQQVDPSQQQAPPQMDPSQQVGMLPPPPPPPTREVLQAQAARQARDLSAQLVKMKPARQKTILARIMKLSPSVGRLVSLELSALQGAKKS